MQSEDDEFQDCVSNFSDLNKKQNEVQQEAEEVKYTP
jgi:hypothetical protein